MKKDGKVSLVTGASSGLGRDIAKLLCEKGHKVYVTARRRKELEKLREECNKVGKGKIEVISGDLTKEKFRIKLINQILGKEGKVDYLINNAGYGKLMSLEGIDFKDIKGMFQLNVIAGQHLTQLLLPLMKKAEKGRIINISSVAGLDPPPPFFSTYNSTKYAVHGFTKSMSYELKDTGVSISVVFPPQMDTPFWIIAFKCGGLTGKKQKVCNEKYTNKAKGSLSIAKYIVKNLDSKKIILLPGFFTKFKYHILRHFQFIGDFYVKYVMLPKTKKMLFHNK